MTKENMIKIRGARENNLKNMDVDIPRGKMVAFTGVSGSGKTTLAFNTIFAEGQRRYIESLSSYARQFLGNSSKPDVESIEGLSPAISIDQKTAIHNPRSTVGTVTEIYDYFRLLFARVGTPHCMDCGDPIEKQTIDQIVEAILNWKKETKIIVKAPVVRAEKGTHAKLLSGFKKMGFSRVEVNGSVYSLDEEIVLDKNIRHKISVVVDRLVIEEGLNKRLTDSLETALKLADGSVVVERVGLDEVLFNTNFLCKVCGGTLPEISPRLFSFNSPFGACESCAGLGVTNEIDVNLIIRNEDLSLAQGAIAASGWHDGAIANMYFEGIAQHFGFDVDCAWKDIPAEAQKVILYGSGKQTFKVIYETTTGWTRNTDTTFEGIIPNLLRRFKETTSDWAREEIKRGMKEVDCTACEGRRLNKAALSVKVGGKDMWELTSISIDKTRAFMVEYSEQIKGAEKKIAAPICKEILARLDFLIDVGLNYLTLARSSSTLSGGKSQRIRLATQIGSGLTGVLYILDEPSIGLHQRDNERLLKTLKHLRDLGNTLIVVEHDEDTIKESDWVIDIGPKAGVHGGKLIFSGKPKDLAEATNSLTAEYITGKRKIEVPKTRRKPRGFVTIKGCKENNLKEITVDFPVGVICAVTGVSGGGKSSLINRTLFPALSNKLNKSKLKVGKFEGLTNEELLDKVIEVDQSP
ncbi:MAG: excinuclease ABC subunit UvrA, partial [Firmicutes bacterium]|nr:excinuclease ABC subunit UvrA [Bacillota bacterium]